MLLMTMGSCGVYESARTICTPLLLASTNSDSPSPTMPDENTMTTDKNTSLTTTDLFTRNTLEWNFKAAYYLFFLISKYLHMIRKELTAALGFFANEEEAISSLDWLKNKR